MSGKIRNNLIGRTFNNLTVIERSDKRGNGKKPAVYWICKCKCGKTTIVSSSSLTSGHTKSCGCLHVKHGFAHKERLYETWKNMRRRCHDPKNKRYKNYGGRGIKICEEWNEYLNFRNWAMNNGYDDTLTIDRIDPNKNYCPENCRWADYKMQANNVTRNHIIQYKGKNYTISQLADVLHISYKAIEHRIARDWSIEKIVNTPVRRY
jgi:hypothetical protein